MPITDDGFEIDPTAPTVLLLGADREGVLSTLRASGRQYVIKRLESNPANWEVICGLLDSLPMRAVLVQLSYRSYRLLERPDYATVRDKLFARVAAAPHLVFVLDFNLGDWSPDDAHTAPDGFSTSDWKNRRRSINAFLYERGLRVTPYSHASEVTVLASAFLAEVEEGLLFRLYVPTGRIWAEQTDKLLQLFRDYLSRIGHKEVRLDQRRTQKGVVFEFFRTPSDSGPASPALALADEFQSFSHLLDLCLSDPSQAEQLLRSKRVDQRDIVAVLTRYAKEARRLQTDMRHEREQKMLAISHRLESELVDLMPSSTELSSIRALTESIVPRAEITAVVPSRDESRLMLTAAAGSSVTVNIRPQVIEAVNSIVAQEIRGNVVLNGNDQALLELIEKHAGADSVALSSDVHELADEAAPGAGRLSARQRLLSFLYSLGDKAADVGVGLLVEYLSKRIGL